MWSQLIIYVIVPPKGEREGKAECLFDLRFFFLWGSGVPWTSDTVLGTGVDDELWEDLTNTVQLFPKRGQEPPGCHPLLVGCGPLQRLTTLSVSSGCLSKYRNGGGGNEGCGSNNRSLVALSSGGQRSKTRCLQGQTSSEGSEGGA